jgi:hypothetical protein
MSIPTIKIGDDNWAVKPNLLLGYNNTNGIYIPREFTVSRGTTALEVNSAGILTIANNNIARIDYLNFTKGALFIEASGKNEIRNNSMVGAVAGTPGNLPNNWAESLNGLVRQSVALGTENGVSYIDIRYSGTATGGSCAVLFETATQIVASTGQTWSNSVYLKIIAQPNPPVAYRLSMWEYNTGGTVFSGSFATAVVPTTTSLQRFTQTRALTGATTDRVRPLFDVSMISGQTYDFTIRIGYPQMELSSFATSVIPTTTEAVSRAADVIGASGISGLIGQTEGTLYAEVAYSSILSAKTIISITDGTANNRFAVRINSTTLITIRILVAGISYDYNLTIPAISSSGILKMAFAYKANNYAFSINGTTYTDTTTRPVPTTNTVALGNNGFSTDFLNDRICAAAIYTTRLSNEQLMLLTSPTYYSNIADMSWAYYLNRFGESVPLCLQIRNYQLLQI